MRFAQMFAAAGVLLAQQTDQPPVVLKASTRLVQVSVIAQDGKGQPIVDLKKDDFRIKVNGKEDSEGVQTLAADARSYTDVGWSAGKENEKQTAVFVRQ